jgi:hypothetical protein
MKSGIHYVKYRYRPTHKGVWPSDATMAKLHNQWRVYKNGKMWDPTEGVYHYPTLDDAEWAVRDREARDREAAALRAFEVAERSQRRRLEQAERDAFRLIYIGDEFYSKTRTMMSSLYTLDGDRCDWGFVQSALAAGRTVTIRPATAAELQSYKDMAEWIYGVKV